MKKIGIQIRDENNNEIYPNPFPIGAVYLSVDSRNPSQIFGGKWEQVKGRFLLGADTSYKVKNTGGNSSHNHSTGNHTLTINEIPAHNHPIKAGYGDMDNLVIDINIGDTMIMVGNMEIWVQEIQEVTKLIITEIQEAHQICLRTLLFIFGTE